MTALVGRMQERRRLRTALEERAPRLLVVRGPSGVGKTALVEQVLADIAPMTPILGRAKYAEQATAAGLRPVVDALSQAADAALGRLYDPAAGLESLRSLLGAQHDTLVGAGFAAAGLAGAITSASAVVPSHAGAARLIDAMVRVLQWLDGFALPVVLFIDDWQRAPNEAVGFVHACTRRSSTSVLKLVLAARDEAAIAYPDQASVVSLVPLATAQQLELLALLLADADKARAVIEWLGEQANGLPFDLTEIALALHRAQAFVGRGDALRVDPARAATIDHRDINQIIVQRARGLPRPTLRLAVAAALWGDRADLRALGRCLAEPPAAVQAAAEALHANGLLRLDGEEIAFPHDRIRASLLQAFDAPTRRALAHAVSDVLLAEESGTRRQTALRLKLVAGVEEVRDPKLAGLFAAEAAAARSAAEFDLAADFGEAAWSIAQRLPGTPDERRAVLREACFAAAHRRQAEATRERCAQMIALASDSAELAEAYERSVVATRLAGTAADAWRLCGEGLARFGVRLPERVTGLHMLLATIAWRLVGRTPRRTARHDARTEQAVTSFGNSGGYAVWERGPRYAAYMAIRMATRARLKGYDSALWLSVDAFISSALKDYRAAAEFGDKAMAALPQLTVGRGMTVHRAILFGKMWRDPQVSLVETSRQIYDFCIAESDLVGAANAMLNEALWTWRNAPTLEAVAATLEETDARAERLGDTRSRAEIGYLAGLVRRLRQPEPLVARPPEEVAPGRLEDATLEVMDHLCLAENWPALLRVARAVRATRSTLDSHLVGVNWRFYENLARLKTGLPPSRADLKFIERIARTNPTDHLGRLLLLRAEHAYRQGRKDCLHAYGEALEAIRKGSSRLEAGLTAECAAAAASGLDDRTAYERFRAAAAITWSGWGAFAKLAAYKADPPDPSIRTRIAEAEAEAALARRGEQAKSRFLAEVGHELRTPLQAMQGLLDLAAERPEEVNLGAIRDVFGSLKSVVDDLTELGALGGEAPLNIRTADLAALLGSELGLQQEAARKKGLMLRADITALQDRFFAIDADRVRQVVRNLLSNAVKYSDAGTIVLSARAGDDIDGRSPLTIAVEDSGPGVPEARLPHLFEPFDRAGRADTQGLGLGLSLSRRIAERMDGSLVAGNRTEGGARFVFSFPAERRDGPAQAPIVARPLTILVVEDTAPIRRLLARLLTLDGHVVIEAESLAESLEQAEDHAVDLVLLDLHLPDGDGLSLLGRWPSRHEQPPAIVLTASVSRETEAHVKAAGAALLRKPIAASDLRAAIAEACGGRPSKTSNGFDAEMARLAQDAREEIASRSAELAGLVRADAPLPQIRQLAHKLAGLAAQFDAPDIAEAADRIEQACAAGASPRPGLEVLEQALNKTASAQSHTLSS